MQRVNDNVLLLLSGSEIYTQMGMTVFFKWVKMI